MIMTIKNTSCLLYTSYSREDEISTAMGSSIAIPHALSLGVRHTSLVFLRLQNPIQWDDDQVQMVFGIAVRKENSGNEHLRILSNLARKLMDLGFTNALLHSDNPDGCLQPVSYTHLNASGRRTSRSLC